MSDQDAYLKSLEEQGRELAKRSDAIEKQEEQTRLAREKLETDRSTWRGAISHYRSFLQSQGKQVPLFDDDTSEAETGTGYSSVNLRVGPKRAKVLQFIAKNMEAGRRVTTREIMDNTGFDGNFVGNVVWADRGRGFLDRVGDKHGMTVKGFEFVAEAGVYTAGKHE